MTQYILSPEAQESLKQIKAYSIQQFGEERTRLYLQDILNRFRALAANTYLGLIRDELKSGYFSSFVGTHTIYYRIKSDRIEIIDVLHQSMEPERHL